MFDLFHRDRRLQVLCVLLLLVSGLVSFELLPRAEDPSLTPRFATLTVTHPGASAVQVETRITEPLEDELRRFEELSKVESTSRLGVAAFRLEIDDAIDDVATIWSRVRDRVSLVELPPGASPPRLEEENAEAFSLIVALVWTGEGLAPASLLSRRAASLEEELRDVSGTEFSKIHGAPREEIRVELDRLALAALGLSVEDVAAELAAFDAKRPAGVVESAELELLLKVEDTSDTLEALRETPLRHGESGRVVLLRDVAEVHRDRLLPQREAVLVDGRRAVSVSARADQDVRIDRWAADAHARLDRFAAALPAGLEMRVLFDQSGYVDRRMAGLWSNLAFGTLGVLLVSWLFLGLRAGLLVGAALPLTFLSVLSGLRFLDIPLHQMSLTGLILALGMLIDNAIIVVDDVRRAREKGASMGEAVRTRVRALAVPLAASTVTTALAFVPIIVMPGAAGEFVGTIGVSVVLAVSSSLLISLSLIAAWAARVSPGANERDSQRGEASASAEPRLPRLHAAWDRSIRAVLARPAWGLLIALSLPALGFTAFGGLKEQFFPPAERDQFQIQMMLPRGSSLEETRRAAQAATELLQADEEVTAVHWFLGTNAPAFYYNLFGAEEGSAHYAQALVQLQGVDGLRDTLRRLQGRLDEALPGAQALVLQLEQGPPFDAPVELRVLGPDLETLYGLGEELRGVLAAGSTVTHTRQTLLADHPRVRWRARPGVLRAAERRAADVATRLRGSLQGVIAGEVWEGTEALPVRVRLRADERDSLDDLAALSLARDGAAGPPLDALGRFELEPEWTAIPHRDGRRLVTVQAFLDSGTLPSVALAAALDGLEERGFELPPGYRLEIGGESSERDDAVRKLIGPIGLVAVAMLFVLVLALKSFRLAGLIASVAVLALGAGFLPLAVFGHPFGFMAIVGAMGLVGLAINDSIVVLEALRSDPEAVAGDRDAMRRVVHESTRHILATTLTTVAGFLPLILAGGGFWPPLAVVIAGGVVGATGLALLWVPSVFALLHRPRTRRPPADPAPTAAP